jgi:hypothetical protein
MKLRNGFVSNSSSSSFICEACGAGFTGERSYFPLYCDYCMEYVLPEEVSITISRKELIEINEKNTDVDNPLLRRIEEFLKEEHGNEDTE